MSCEKNIINMEGKRVDYNNWGKMPYRDPGERMLRVGHGFSKMLSAIKTNVSKQQKPKKTGSRRNLSLDPDAKTVNDVRPNISSSMMEFNKGDDSDFYSTMKPTIKEKKHKLEDHNIAEQRSPEVKRQKLPKIESTKAL